MFFTQQILRLMKTGRGFMPHDLYIRVSLDPDIVGTWQGSCASILTHPDIGRSIYSVVMVLIRYIKLYLMVTFREITIVRSSYLPLLKKSWVGEVLQGLLQ